MMLDLENVSQATSWVRPPASDYRGGLKCYLSPIEKPKGRGDKSGFL